MSTLKSNQCGSLPDRHFGIQSSRDESSENIVEQFSSFGDGACGEPIATQHLLLDFTPDEEIDNEIVQKKICDFWKFINSSTEIKNLMVKPEKPQSSAPPKGSSETLQSDYTDEAAKPESGVNMGMTAVSMLSVVEKKGLINRTFNTKMPHLYCPTAGLQEYKENVNAVMRPQMKTIRRQSSTIECKCMGSINTYPDKAIKSLKPTKLCQQLDEWDAMHPKSLEPPGHPPSLQHCVLQGQVWP